MATTVTSTTRIYNGVEFPIAGDWALDPAHTTIGFTVKHLMVAKVKGHFGSFEGVLHIAEDAAASSTQISIQADSIDTGVPQRDDHLRSPDFLDAGQYGELTFTTSRFEHVGGSEWRLYGDLEIHGVTHPVVLDTEYNGNAIDPWGAHRAFFSAETKIDREAWGLTWNQALETGGWLVGKDIKVELEVEAVLQQG
jgi:polyisoprenoid-binding protein YceI